MRRFLWYLPIALLLLITTVRADQVTSAGGGGGAATKVSARSTRAGNGLNVPIAMLDVCCPCTLTVSQVLDYGYFLNFSPSTLCNGQLPTAQGAGGLVQALPAPVQVGDTFNIHRYFTTAGFSVTLSTGAGITFYTDRLGVYSINTYLVNVWKVDTCIVTSVVPNAETLTCW